MVKVNVQPDCGNAPKGVLLRDFTIAIANNDLPIIFNCVIDEVEWKLLMVGKETIIGKSAIDNAFNEMFDTGIEEMTIAVIERWGDGEMGRWGDGEVCSTKGIITTIDGKTYSFTNVCLFTSNDESAKIKQIASFLTEGLLDGPNSWGQFPSHTHF